MFLEKVIFLYIFQEKMDIDVSSHILFTIPPQK